MQRFHALLGLCHSTEDLAHLNTAGGADDDDVMRRVRGTSNQRDEVCNPRLASPRRTSDNNSHSFVAVLEQKPQQINIFKSITADSGAPT